MAGWKVRVGNVEILSLSDGQGSFPPTAFFPDSDEAVWRQRYSDHLGPDGTFRPNFGCFVIRSQGKTLLVDTGIGPQNEALGGLRGRLMEELKEKGVSPEEVSIVVFTHLHPDHVGWNLYKEGSAYKPYFPRARYICSKGDWDFFTGPEGLRNFPYIKEQVMPLRDLALLDLIDGEYALTDEVRTVPTPGHTPGHLSLAIASGGELAFILGDVAHSPVQATETDWNCGFDVQPEVARKTRHEILDMLEREGRLVGAGHFPVPSFGRFVRVNGQRVWRPLT